jgi:hypothetical protein
LRLHLRPRGDLGKEIGTKTGVLRYWLMAKPWKSPHDQAAAIQLWIISLILAAASGLCLLFYSVTRPTVYANPGIASYTPPPGTRLIPLPRTSDAPQLVDIPPAEDSSPLKAFAQAQPNEKPAKPDVRQPARKRPRPDPREYEERKPGYAQQWNNGYHDWNNNRAAGAGFRSWF